MNLVVHALGLSLKIIGSPATGLTNPADMARFGAPFSWRGEGNTTLIMGDPVRGIPGKSRELQHTFMNMDRDFREQMEAAMRGNKWTVWQGKAMQFSFYPIVKAEQYFRKVTFYNEYKNALEAGRSEGDAIALADSAIRGRHGSGAVSDLPRIMRSNEAMKLATVFYGFFNTMYNWQRQIPGAVKRGDYMQAAQAAWGAALVPAAFGILLFNKKTEDESFPATIAKGIALQLGGTVPFLREFANLALEGQSARSPWSSLIDAAVTGYKDIAKRVKGKPGDKELKHAANAIGLLGGLPMGQIGRTGQFAYDVQAGRQRPKSINEWMRGIIHGEAKLKKGGR